jgi:cytochrome c oxidase subunit 3
MGEILPYRPPRARAEWTAYLGMVIFLGSWAMMFGSLFFAYGMVRARSSAWPPPDLPELPVAVGAVNTVVLAFSSAILQLTVRNLRRGQSRFVAWGIAASTLLGAAFLAIQVSSWRRLLDDGLTPSGGPYPSVFYGLTCFHGLHVLIGIVALGWLTGNAFAGKYSAARFLPLRLWTLYWHFVGAVWLAMFLVVYVL